MFNFLFPLSLMSLFSKWNNFISLLLVIEFMVISLCLVLFVSAFSKIVFFVFIVICVLEAIMGLIMAVLLVRFYGSDFFSGFFW